MAQEYVFIHTSYKGVGEKAEIKEIAALRTNDKGEILCSRSEVLIDPVNNAGVVSFSQASRNIRETMLDQKYSSTPAIVVFHEIHKAMIRAAEKDADVPLFDSLVWVQVSQLVWPFFCFGLIKDRSLKGLVETCKLVGYSGSGSPSEDASFLSRIYFSLMRRYRTALKAEEIASELGGDKFNALRDLFGF